MTGAADDSGAAAETLQLLIGAAHGAREELMMIERPARDGRTRVRHWSSGDWSAAPTSSERRADDLLAEIERAVRAGRSLNVEMAVVRRWLGGGMEPRSR